MSVRSLFVRLVAVTVLVLVGESARAADVSAPPAAAAPVYGDPAAPAMPGCAACQGGAYCQHGAIRGKCDVCGKLLGSNLHKLKHKKDPFPVTLCPGACFGYFQTQWRKWDEVCPYPYTGTGVSDAAKPISPSTNPRPAGTGLEAPRTLEKGMTEPKKSDLPAIPNAGSKFGP
jgi:hypothetical protein